MLVSPTLPTISSDCISTSEVLERNGIDGAVAGLITGDHHIGDALCESEHVTLGGSMSLHD